MMPQSRAGKGNVEVLHKEHRDQKGIRGVFGGFPWVEDKLSKQVELSVQSDQSDQQQDFRDLRFKPKPAHYGEGLEEPAAGRAQHKSCLAFAFNIEWN